MKKFLLKYYYFFGITDVDDWNIMQLLFGKRYLGIFVLCFSIAIIVSLFS